jgi:hypothetical protein
MERLEKEMNVMTLRPGRISFRLLVILLTLLLLIGCRAQVPERQPPPVPPDLPGRSDISGYKTEHVFIVVMDGVRYSETFGDPTRSLIPHLDRELRPRGTLFTHYYNRGVTVTRQGHSTLISGTWQTVPNGGPRLTRPTLFEYYRDEKRAPPPKCWSVFAKGPYAFDHYSSHPAYGSRYAGRHAHGGREADGLTENAPEGDAVVVNRVIEVMKTDQPDIVFINFGHTDHVGHGAKDISEYYAAIKNCDEQMWRLWNAIQSDLHYRDTTTVFFTNDHGRHTTDFHSHGDHCEGCEHIMLLVLGPDIRKGAVVEKEALQIDVATTAAELIGLQTPLATGRVLAECLTHHLELNRKESRTEAARWALQFEQLADRDLIKAAADYLLVIAKPEGVAANLTTEVVLKGMLRAHGETKDPRYLQFIERWIDSHKQPKPLDQQAILGKIILELPSEVRQSYLDRAAQIGDRVLARPPDIVDQNQSLIVGIFLGRLSEVMKKPRYEEQGLRIIKAALRQPVQKQPTDVERAYELFLLGQAAALFRDDITVMKAYILTAAQALSKLKEAGVLWDDPLVSVLNLCGIEASTRRGAMREFTQRREQDALPACVQATTLQELRMLFPDRPKAPLRNLQSQLVQLVYDRGKQGFPFSVDMLRYGVNEAGVYGNGSPAAQGAFLLSFKRLDWRYGGNTWPGPDSGKRP